MYNATALLEERLSYVKVMLDKYQKLPTGRGVPPPATAPASVQVSVASQEEVSPPKLLNTVVTAIKNAASGNEEVDSGERSQVRLRSPCLSM